jgi:hypothetical protein
MYPRAAVSMIFRALLLVCLLGPGTCGCARLKNAKDTAVRPGPLVPDEKRFGPDSPVYSINKISRS